MNKHDSIHEWMKPNSRKAVMLCKNLSKNRMQWFAHLRLWENQMVILNLMAATWLIKLGNGPVYYCVASLILLTAACNHLGTDETSCWSFVRLKVRSRIPAAQHSWICCVVFVSWWDTYWSKVWTAVQPFPHSSVMKPCFCYKWNVQFCIFVLKYTRD